MAELTRKKSQSAMVSRLLSSVDEDTAGPGPDIADQPPRGAYRRTASLVDIEAGPSAASHESVGTGRSYA